MSRLRALRGVNVELRDGADGSLLDAGWLEADNGALAAPLPIPIVTNAPSAWRSLKTAAGFERLLATELLWADP